MTAGASSQPGAAMVPAVVFGRGITLLGVLRALHKASVPVYVGGAAEGPALWSRHFRRLPEASSVAGDTPSIATALQASGLEQAVVISCADSLAVELAALPAELRGRFRTSCPRDEIQALLADKLEFSRLLRRLEVPHPRTIEVFSTGDLAAVPADEIERFFLKPADSESFNRQFGVKACRFETKDEALSEFARLSAAGVVFILQEYIKGPPTNHYFVDGFVDRQGVVKARFARRRIRMRPHDLGNSTSMVSVPITEVSGASEALDRIFEDLGYRGIFSAEFKRDHDGVLKLLEINARPWWYVGFASNCGVNVVAMAYQDALEQEVTPVREYDVGRWCIYPQSDLKAIAEQIRGGQSPELASLWQVLRCDQPVFDWRDPGPLLQEFAGAARFRLGRLRARR